MFVAGSALHPRTSSATLTYSGAGCSNANEAITTDLQLPNGSTLEGVRTYYYDNAAPGRITIFVTKYDGTGATSDIIMSSLPDATGHASVLTSPSATEVIDNVNQSYVLTASTGTDVRICGFRVFYSMP